MEDSIERPVIIPSVYKTVYSAESIMRQRREEDMRNRKLTSIYIKLAVGLSLIATSLILLYYS